jgi:UMF1 family MFS transporter
MLYFFAPPLPNVFYGVLCFALAAIGYIGSLVFYNSYLPEIAAPEDRDRISARGFSMGYIGSVILQLLGFGLVLYFSGKGDDVSGPWFTFLLVGVWWIGFAQITFATLPHGMAAVTTNRKNAIANGFKDLHKVWLQVKEMPTLKRYLFAFAFYSMGVQTVMLAATVFGKQLLNLSDTKLIVTVVLIQLVAVAGAFTMAKLSEKFGNLKVLIGVIILWIFICISAYIIAVEAERGVNAEYGFYGLAMAVGLVMGGVQSLSRSTYSKLMPVTKDTASYFSFYDVTEKIAIVIGMFSFGFIDELAGMKNSVLALIVFFAIGLFGLFAALRSSKREIIK